MKEHFDLFYSTRIEIETYLESIYGKAESKMFIGRQKIPLIPSYSLSLPFEIRITKDGSFNRVTYELKGLWLLILVFIITLAIDYSLRTYFGWTTRLLIIPAIIITGLLKEMLMKKLKTQMQLDKQSLIQKSI